MKPETKTSHRLGELLLSSSVLTTGELEHAVELSSETGLPMGRVLVMCGYITERELEAAVKAQSLVKDGALTGEKAREAIQLMSKKGMDFERCLKSVGFTRDTAEPTFRLGELLVEAHILTKSQLKDVLRTSQETGLPVGRVLVLTGVISEEMLSAALTAQVLVRDNKISPEQAVQALSSSRFRRVNIEVSLMDLGFYKPPPRQRVRIGELLVLSGLVNEPDLMTALELGLIREAPVGQMLVEGGFISRRILDTALKLQEIVSSHSPSALKASEALRQVAVNHVSLARAISELELESSERKERVRLGEMLKACGIVGDTDIKKALKDASRNSALLGKVLLVTGVIDEHTLHAALRLLLLLRSEKLTMEQAIIALNHARKHKLTIDESLQELKWAVLEKEDDYPLDESQGDPE
ncbi:MAG: hypothetical protein IPL73_02735 [Candidatus Obscuribacter sp.]|nr:hypothetical protein [Candidatus Obscuribacter sp.]